MKSVGGERTWVALLQMMRPANMVTAAADILAGYTIGSYFHQGSFNLPHLVALILASMCLYAGGIILNDVFDLELDRIERPERPLPSGAISLRLATYMGILFLLVGLGFAALAGGWSIGIALLVAFLAVTYDALAKLSPVFGPLTMGACRAGNLMLGASAFGSVLGLWPIAIIPFLFIGAVTMVSRGEVEGGGKGAMILAAFIYAIIVISLAGWAIWVNEAPWLPLLFVGGFVLTVYPPLFKAIQKAIGPNVGQAVKWGVLGLIPMDAAWGCIFGGWTFGLVILLLLPVSIGLARLFAVT